MSLIAISNNPNENSEIIFGIEYDTYKFILCNSAMEKRYPDCKGQYCYQVMHNRDCPCEDCPLPLLKSKQIKITMSCCVSSDLTWRPILVNCDTVLGDFCLGTAGFRIDLKKSLDLIQSAVNTMNSMVYIIGKSDYRLHFLNKHVKNIFPNAHIGALCYKALWNRNSPCEDCPMQALSSEKTNKNIKFYNPKLKKHFNIQALNITENDSSDVVVFIASDITDIVKSEQHLKQIAYTDVRLLVKNSAAFNEAVNIAFESGKTHFIYFMRLRNFDHYNLTFGRSAGDKLLKQLAGYYIRTSPTEVYRISGTKFAFIAQTEYQMQKITEILKTPVPSELLEDYKGFYFNVDSLVIEIPKYSSDADKLMRTMEDMLKKQENNKENEIIIFNEQDMLEFERKNKVKYILQSHMLDHSFEMYYQPIYSIENGKFTQCEALMRMFDNEFGIIPPSDFIPIAEECGMIHELGIFALESACKFVKDRQNKNLPPIQVNVNVSMVQFYYEEFFNMVMKTISKYNIDHSMIHLELTESTWINSFKYVTQTMHEFINHNIKFSIDDFGTGYSNLSYIGSLPIDIIKIDKSFIDKIESSDIHVLIVRNIIDMAKQLKIKTTAEGVETKSQYDILKNLGCDNIQGYLFSKPLPYDKFSEFIDKKLAEL